MLVLQRFPNEAIMIGRAIQVELVEIIGDKVRLRFNVPKDIKVFRREVYEAIRAGEIVPFDAMEGESTDGEIGSLTLTRLVGEEVVIGDDILVKVVDIRGSKVRIGIQAPKGISIHRQEVYDAIHKQ